MDSGTTEVWLRNPRNYIRECVEVGSTRFAWDVGSLYPRGIDPYKFHDLYHGVGVPWEALIIGHEVTHIDREHPMDSPKGLYPVWTYGDNINILENLMAEIPSGQRHLVVVTGLPPVGTGVGKQTVRLLDEMQRDYPDCALHIHGLYSFRAMFGLSFQSVDCDPRTTAQKGRVYMPTGKEVTFEATFEMPHWVTLLGMRPVELRVPRNRCMFNIKACMWSAQYFKDAVKVETRSTEHNTDPTATFAKQPTSKSIFLKRIRPSEGDKFLCNTCTLQTACKYFREGAVCIVPGSEAADLAKLFKSRDSDSIMEGLSSLLAAESHRLNKALESESAKNELNPETTKIINTLFDRGVKLAKLRDPALAAAGAARINLTGTTNNTQINMATPQALMAGIVEEFLKRGIAREDITPEMIMKVFESPDDLKQKAIEAASVDKSA